MGALTLTCDLEFQSRASCGHDPYMCKIQDHRSVGSKDRMERNRQTNGRTRPIAVPVLKTL